MQLYRVMFSMPTSSILLSREGWEGEGSVSSRSPNAILRAPDSPSSRGSCGKTQSLALNHSLLDQNLRGGGEKEQGEGEGDQECAFSQNFPPITVGALCQVWDLLQLNKMLSEHSHQK